MTDRTPEEIRGGRVMSSQCMFATALGHERALGLDRWADEAPQIAALGMSVGGPGGERLLDWVGRLDGSAQSVDQRAKMPAWLETFADRGGRVLVGAATVAELDRLSPSYDLVLVASGRGALAELFTARRRALPVRPAAARAGGELRARPGAAARARLRGCPLQRRARRRRAVRDAP
ncbi:MULTISPECIES: hypothetical protein [Kitasatospora]|uniref:Uncharacterized protein n=1 Tax=Kitasatospora aburaviensis TaxID=67265 RepID=A0ABW1FC24_9ACTN